MSNMVQEKTVGCMGFSGYGLQETAWLLRCAAAALETPGDLTPDEIRCLAVDCGALADELEKGHQTAQGLRV